MTAHDLTSALALALQTREQTLHSADHRHDAVCAAADTVAEAAGQTPAVLAAHARVLHAAAKEHFRATLDAVYDYDAKVTDLAQASTGLDPAARLRVLHLAADDAAAATAEREHGADAKAAARKV